MTQVYKHSQQVSDITEGDLFISPFEMKDPDEYPYPSRVALIVDTEWAEIKEIRLENGKSFFLNLGMKVIMGELA